MPVAPASSVIASPTRAGGTARLRHAAAMAVIALTGGELIARHAASPLNAEPAERYAVFRQLPAEQLQGLQILKRELAAWARDGRVVPEPCRFEAPATDEP